MKSAYFHCFAGISGDMIVGALLDAGLDLKLLKDELARLDLHGYRIKTEQVTRNSISGTRFIVEADNDQESRNINDISAMLDRSSLDGQVKEQAEAIFRRIAEAEAKIHNTTVREVHFHEVGAVDSIVDVVAAVSGLKLTGIESVYSSPIHLGSGFTGSAHGTLPVPSPATVELLSGVPVYSRGIEHELATPTGSAIISTVARGFGPLPAMEISSCGYGAGSRDLKIPNLLRVIIGRSTGSETDSELLVQLETNIDDMNPELYEHVSDELFRKGALDVYTVPVIMKKSRPGSILTVICSQESMDSLMDTIFRETTTSGVRINSLERRALSREMLAVSTMYGKVSVKVHRIGNEVTTVSPEYEECRARAREQGVPLKTVFDMARSAAMEEIKKNK
jgi:uncharacterized protein (TIGR00299 family) protein